MKFILFFLLLILVPAVSGAIADTSVFDKYVASGAYSTTDRTNFSLFVNERTMKCFVQVLNSSLIIANGSCVTEGDLVFCVKDIRQTEEFNQELFTWVYEARIGITRETPEVAMKTTYEKSSLLIGEKTDVTLGFSNTGDKPASNVQISYSYPLTLFRIGDAEGCRKDAGSLSWSGDLLSGVERECKFELIALSSGEGLAKAEMLYFDGQKTQRLESKQKLQVKGYVVQAKTSLRKTKFSVGDTSIFWVNLTPTMDIKWALFSVSFPEGVAVLSAPEGFNIAYGKYSLEGDIEKPEKFKFSLRMDYQGNFTINSFLTYQVEDLTHEYSTNNSFSVHGDRLQIKQYTNKIQNSESQFYVVNPTGSNFSNLDVNYTIVGVMNHTRSSFIDRMRNIPIPFSFQGGAGQVEVVANMTYKTSAGQPLKEWARLAYTNEVTVVANETPTTQKPDAAVNGSVEPAPKTQKKASGIVGVYLGLAVVLVVFIYFIFRSIRQHEKGFKGMPPQGQA